MVWQQTRSTRRAQLLRRRLKGGLAGGASGASVARVAILETRSPVGRDCVGRGSLLIHGRLSGWYGRLVGRSDGFPDYGHLFISGRIQSTVRFRQ